MRIRGTVRRTSGGLRILAGMVEQERESLEGDAYMPGHQLFQFHGPFVQHPRLNDYYVRHRLLPARR